MRGQASILTLFIALSFACGSTSSPAASSGVDASTQADAGASTCKATLTGAITASFGCQTAIDNDGRNVFMIRAYGTGVIQQMAVGLSPAAGQLAVGSFTASDFTTMYSLLAVVSLNGVVYGGPPSGSDFKAVFSSVDPGPTSANQEVADPNTHGSLDATLISADAGPQGAILHVDF